MTTTFTQEELDKAMERTRIELMKMRDCTFFITLAFSLKTVWDDLQPTAWTDGYNIGWNTKFFMGQGSLPLTERQRVFVLVHEAMHVALMHCTEMFIKGNYVHWILNQAMDHVINLILLERKFDVPQWACCDRRFTGMNTFEVYAILYKEWQDGKLKEENKLDDVKPAPDGITSEEMTEHIQDLILLGKTQSELAGEAGTLPRDIEIFLKKLLEPKLPWHRILLRYMKNMAKNDYSFHKPNKRYLPDYYMPTLYSESVKDLTFALDISGSVSRDQFTQFVSDIGQVLKVMRPKKITVLLFDTRIISINEVSNVKELLDIKFRGGGSTDPNPVFEWAKDNSSDLLLMFTDGWFNYLGDYSKVNTIWLINDNPNFKSQWGKVIHFDT